MLIVLWQLYIIWCHPMTKGKFTTRYELPILNLLKEVHDFYCVLIYGSLSATCSLFKCIIFHHEISSRTVSRGSIKMSLTYKWCSLYRCISNFMNCIKAGNIWHEHSETQLQIFFLKCWFTYLNIAHECLFWIRETLLYLKAIAVNCMHTFLLSEFMAWKIKYECD